MMDEWKKQSNRWFLSLRNLASISNEYGNTEQNRDPKEYHQQISYLAVERPWR
jgi:hypothetical protein